MKNVKTILGLVLAAGALFFTSCSQTDEIDESMVLADKSAAFATALGDSCTYDGEITEADVEGLLFMLEEEKLAHDVYLNFYNSYGTAIFQNIANSEQAHMTAVQTLLEGYGIAYTEPGAEGEFENEDLAALYVTLTAQGAASLVDALVVGATIEDLDISDLNQRMGATANADIIRVYGNLKKGSESHMRAFVSNLTALDGEYTNQYISDEDYAAILAGSNSRGNGNGGNGNGQGGSNGYNTAGGDCDGTGTATSNGNQGGNRQNGKNGN
ncbi:DUF2202 domain-containing protein [Draconibacterium sp. IB214405]|uniref:DUF2202 domain-containing protein n=1 Tax=Draconibacterium sp. IB214405 TaxID=3097352 RepID=UPI002A0C4B91|nr:DUF2202 domain-containing protein [Draconibacterium sp. IB214405]MDX8338145.1 DUF2202 domain-containing protein [Draconibacterium sp. IB214405]